MNTKYPTTDPRFRSARVKSMLHQLVAHLREDVHLLGDARAEALFETAAEVLSGLEMAFNHYENRSEEAWTK